MTNRNIILIGFMGSGKTVVGKELAKRMGMKFVDTDELIVQRADLTIPQIFDRHGEAHFRDLEKKVIAEVAQRTRTVIATGGGCICYPETRDENLRAFRQNGFLVYLKASAETLFLRTLSMTDRPLLQVPDRFGHIQRLLSEREPFYRQASLILYTDNLKEEEVAPKIERWYSVLPDNARMVTVDLERRSYPVVISTGLLSEAVELFKDYCPKHVVIMADETVASLYGQQLEHILKEAGVAVQTVTVPAGEQSKSWEQAYRLMTFFAECGLGRDGGVVALGGGMVGDLAGFVASIYKRGIKFIQIPTTLLAMVDAAIGGKTGVDHPKAKNLIGTFWQPSLVVCDLDTIKTLPEREFRAGLAEVVKYGVICPFPNQIAHPQEFFCFLEEHADEIVRREPTILADVIERCVRIKAEIVSLDEREVSQLRAVLNYGHTFAHGLEAATGYFRFLHGEAVAIGMTAAAFLAERLGMCKEELRQRQTALLQKFGLPTHALGVDLKAVRQAMRLDKKEGRFVLPLEIGIVTQKIIPEDAIHAALKFMTKETEASS